MSQLSYWKVLTRRKTIGSTEEQETKLHRVLGTFDLTALGVGATLGVGVYVLAGHVARDQAGPSVVLSFAIAAIASLFAGLCYAEFGARVPKAGSAYIYSYVCIGELAAFVIGWNLILEYIIGSASVSKGLSLYLDTLINDTFKNTFRDVAPIYWDFLDSYFDFFAFSSPFLFGIALAFGLHQSKTLNNVFTVLNVGIVIFVIVCGAINADIKNWQIDPEPLADQYAVGAGGFFPFGFEGTLKGAATCFFGFVGFDCIATTGEEVRNPRRSIPRSILFSLLIIFLSYFGVSTVLTLMYPYYLQNVDAPLPYAFEQIGWNAAKWVVTIGGMIGLVASLFGAMFPLPRIIYAMAQDGLVFHFLGEISPKFNTPVAGTLCAAALTGLMAAVFNLSQLVNMLSIGTLLAYTVVAISITILRFMDNDIGDTAYQPEIIETTTLTTHTNRITSSKFILQIFNVRQIEIPNTLSTRVVGTALFIYSLCCFGLSLCLMYTLTNIQNGEAWAIALSATFLIVLLLLLLAIAVQPKEKPCPTFTVPLVPLIPGLSILINIYLMLQLDIYTWIRFGIWMSLGTIIYLACICLYGTIEARNPSVLEKRPPQVFRNGKLNGMELSFSTDPDAKSNENLATTTTTASITSIEIENESQTSTVIADDSRRSKTPSPRQYLDEIVSESELHENIIEMKNSNGKTIFVEDSSISANKYLDPSAATTLADSEAPNDDAKSVIAILDDVLQVEELQYSHNDDRSRKVSIDSNQIPAFVEHSTIAMVHMYDHLREENETDDSERNAISSDGEIMAPDSVALTADQTKFALELEKHVEIYDIARNLVEEILEQVTISQEIYKNPTTEISVTTEPSSPILFKKGDNGGSSPTISVSRKSSTSISSNDDNLKVTSSKTQKFRNKLSLLMMGTPPNMSPNMGKQPEKYNNIDEKPSPSSPSYPVRSSKSESDIQSVLRLELAESEMINISPIAGAISSHDTAGNIPKAPKFDPILYKTVGTRKHNDVKYRPMLRELIRPVAPVSKLESTATEVPAPLPEKSHLPFKAKLEALLKRGPSWRMASIPHLPTTAPPPSLPIDSIEIVPTPAKPIANGNAAVNKDEISRNDHIRLAQQDHKSKISNVLEAIKSRHKNLEDSSEKVKNRPKTIEEALNSLRHVELNS